MAINMSKQKGFALLIVLSLSVVAITIISEILFQTDIEARASIGERNKLNAELAAITGSQFVRFLFAIDSKIPAEARTIVEEQLQGKKVFQLLDDFPIGGESFEAVKDLGQININKLMDEKLLNALKGVNGYFVIKTSDESSKLNLNVASMGAYSQDLFLCLKRIFSTPREKQFLEDKGINPARLAANVVDYIDPDNKDKLEPESDESNQYDQAKFKHRPKDGPLESLEELRRIPGFNDDEVYNVFSPYFTVWPIKPTKFNATNVNTMPIELLSALLSEEGQDVAEDNMDRFEDEFKKNPLAVPDLRELPSLCKTISGGKDCPDYFKRFAAITSSIYKVEIQGISKDITRTLVYVFDRGSMLSSTEKNVKDTTTTSSSGPAASKLKIIYQRFL